MPAKSKFELTDVDDLKANDPTLTDADAARILGVKRSAISQKRTKERERQKKKEEEKKKNEAKKRRRSTNNNDKSSNSPKNNSFNSILMAEVAKQIAPLKVIQIASKLYNKNYYNKNDSIRLTDKRYNYLKDIIGFNYSNKTNTKDEIKNEKQIIRSILKMTEDDML